jgi:hypothetical protein
MALKGNFYKASKNTLGPENISGDFVVTETYAKTGKPMGPKFEAVALPKDTEKSRQWLNSGGSPTELSTLPVDYGFNHLENG